MADKGKGSVPDQSIDLEVGHNPSFQRREWRFVRAGWVVLTLFIVAGLLGLVGPGPLSETTAASGSGRVAVEYQRIGHNEADDTLVLRLSEETVRQGTVTARFTGSWAEGVDVSGITPAPGTEYAIPGGVAYEFEVLEAGGVTASFSFRATEHGTLNGRVAVGGDSVGFTQFILP